jgi:hypothetical protein
MKNSLTLVFSLVLSMFIAGSSSAQTTLYTQNFDGSSSFPAGWYASANSWVVDTAGTNASSSYTGASGANNVAIKDTTARLGNDTLITSAIATTGYNNITIEWGTRFSKHFADSGSTIALFWTVDGTTWTPVTYTENANNSAWYLDNDSTPIALPAGAANAAALRLMWVADIHFTPSGTYRIDDLKVAGTQLPSGINSISESAPFAKVYAGNNSINVAVAQPLTDNTTVEVYDLTGRMVTKTEMTSQNITTGGYTTGIYIVKVYSQTQSSTSKVVVK